MRTVFFFLAVSTTVFAQQAPYDVFPAAEPPYYRVRFDASAEAGGLIFPVNYTIWIPPGVKALRGVVVHQHGCGEGSCKSGLTGAFDLHWQALAAKHECALLSPAYEQPEKADCQMWCDPRNGSDAAFQKGLAALGKASGHPELPNVPWALWGHSGGGHWAGGMALLHPQRVAAAWLRSGVPSLQADGKRAAYTVPDAALLVPMMCNLGTKEGFSVKDGRFAGVWPANESFITAIRKRGGLVGAAVDPLSAHECGNSRYLAIPWLDACLAARLPEAPDEPLKQMPAESAMLVPLPEPGKPGVGPVASASFPGAADKSVWLPNPSIASAWTEYTKDTKVSDTTPPPAPVDLRVNGSEVTWSARADLESGLAHFIIERDGKPIGTVPERPANPFGRPVFQGQQYSDTPAQPLVAMRFTDPSPEVGKTHRYKVIAVNTVGLRSK